MNWDEQVLERVGLGGGSIAQVERWRLRDGTSLVAKLDPKSSGSLLVEAKMLDYLGRIEGFPCPKVIDVQRGRLLMSDLEGRPGPHFDAEEQIASALATVHATTAPCFGFPFDTVIAELPQRNESYNNWARFYAERRLGDMADLAERAGRLPKETRIQVDRISERIEDELPRTPRIALIHGDLWSGNVLSEGKKLCGFVDPALYFADAEIELAFMRLFGGFSERFFARYDAIHKPEPGDRARRTKILQLYPLLVHVRLFGGGYLSSLQALLAELTR